MNIDVNGDDVTRSRHFDHRAKYIGRIGGLAVVLGIGAAIGGTAATALADNGGSDAATTQRSAQAKQQRTERQRPTRDRDQRAASTSSRDRSARSARDAHDAESDARPVRKPVRLTSLVRTPERDTEPAEPITPSDDPATPPHTTGVSVLLGTARRDAPDPETLSTTRPLVTSTLATDEQLAAEQRAAEIARTPIVQLAKVVLKVAWFISAQHNFALVGGPDRANLARLDQAVDEYVMQAAMEVQLLNPTQPKLLQQVMPPHTWSGQTVEGTRIWYDNPDTIYRFVGVNAASEYVITGQFAAGERPADTNFSVLTGLNGQTAHNLNGSELEVDSEGRFTITVSAAPPGNPDADHLQLPPEATLITTRNTLSDWNTQSPMAVSIQRIGGPPNSLFAQIGGFLIPGIGPAVTQNPALVSLVSLIPPLPNPPLLLQSVETALLMLILGITKQDEYIAVATRDAETGTLRAPNTLSEPTYNAQFLSTQLQSAGYFQLTDDQALVLTVDPGSAPYFVVPVTNDWTITDNYWDQQTSLNNAQAIANGDGTYTIIVSKGDSRVANWVSTGGLNQGTMSIRFQGVDQGSPDQPTVTARVVPLAEVSTYVEATQLVYDRQEQIRQRQAGYANRY